MAQLWGFTLQKSNQIDLDKISTKYFSLLQKAEPSINLCINCGSCTATCTSGHFTEFSLRKINTYLARGQYQQVVEMANKCILCGKCILVCPRNVNTRNIIFQINKLFKTYI